MGFSEDLITILTEDGVGISKVNMFRSTAKVLPTGAGPFLSIMDTGGTSPNKTHNAVVLPAYQQPGAQLVVRAETYPAAYTMARNAYNSLVKVNNRFVGNDPSFIGSGNSFVGSGGTWYVKIDVRQEPFDMGIDGDGRARCGFNVLGQKRPSYR